VLGGGTIGLMVARLLVLEGRTVTLADRHPERREQAQAFGAHAVEALEPASHPVVFEAVGRPETWASAVEAVMPGGAAVLVGGCAMAAVPLPSAPIHYDEVDIRGAFHHDRADVDHALDLLATGAVDWRALAGDHIGLDDLATALTAATTGAARKLVVEPWR
jgi:L-iditol 2-dehydrogenase